MLPSLVLPPLADSAPLLTCLLDLVWGRPLSDVEITVVSQVSNGCFVIFEIALVERPAAVCLTVVLNVVCHSERESAQVLGGCPFLDLMSQTYPFDSKKWGSPDFCNSQNKTWGFPGFGFWYKLHI